MWWPAKTENEEKQLYFQSNHKQEILPNIPKQN